MDRALRQIDWIVAAKKPLEAFSNSCLTFQGYSKIAWPLRATPRFLTTRKNLSVLYESTTHYLTSVVQGFIFDFIFDLIMI